MQVNRKCGNVRYTRNDRLVARFPVNYGRRLGKGRIPGRTMNRSFQEKRREDLDQQELALRRVGATPEERLRWVLNFTNKLDLDELGPGAKNDLGYDLWQITAPVGWLTQRRMGPMPERQLREIQRAIAEGIQALFANRGRGEALLDPGWKLPVPRRARLIRLSDPGAKPTLFIRIFDGTSEEGSIINGVADLILRAGGRLRSCVECGAPFVARKRQAYCETKCSQKARNRKKARPGKTRRRDAGRAREGVPREKL